MATLIADASVAVKWFFAEDDSQRAISLRGGGLDFIAPDLIIADWQRR